MDYAHRPASYEAILSLLLLFNSALIVVFGHGGKRDQNKRPLLGATAAKYADLIILNSDNSRSEDPKEIIDEIAQGIFQKKNKLLFSKFLIEH